MVNAALDMAHLTQYEIEAINGNESVARATCEHFSKCVVCQQRVADAARFERALRQLERVTPESDLPARIIASLPQNARDANTNAWLGVATLLTALIGFALAYQAAFTLNANGAFELVSSYTFQPEIVAMYPDQAWSALASAIPWMTVAISFVMFTIALGLTVRWSQVITPDVDSPRTA